MTAGILVAGAGLIAAGIPLSALRGARGALAVQLAGAAVVTAGALAVLASGDAVGGAFHGGVAPRLGLDRLSALFALVVCGTAIPALLCARDQLAASPVRRPLLALTAAFLLSMLGVLAARDVATFLGSWELMTLVPATAILVARRDAAVRRAVFAYVAITHLGGAGVWVALLTLAHHDAFGAAMTGGPQALVLVAALVGFGTKAGVMPLHVWLPRAHPVAPPHVSALMSGVMLKVALYGLVRVLFEWAAPAPLWAGLVLLAAGVLSAVAGVLYALVQRELKRLLAFSSVENVGVIVAALGAAIVLADAGDERWAALAFAAALLHTLNHAAFKALLFLGAGSVIHAMHHEQDMRHMGGLRKHIPFTAAMMTIGTLALTGFPFTAGYFSKDAIIEAAYASHTPGANFAFIATVIAALFTSFYSWRLYFLTFEGKPRWAGHGHGHDDHGHGHGDHTPHESPLVMLIPLAVLAIGAVVAGFAFKEAFIGHDYDNFWKGALFTGANNHILHEMHEVPGWVVASPFVMMVLGFLIALWFYVLNPRMPAALAAQQPLLYRFLLNKWYFDELYDFLFVRPAMWLGRVFWKKGDGWLIDGFGPDGVSARVVDVTNRVVRLQTGYVFHYAFAMLVGVAALVTWYLIGGTH